MKATELIVQCLENEPPGVGNRYPPENTLRGNRVQQPKLQPDPLEADAAVRPAFVDFKNPDIVKYAESFGVHGFSIESADEPAPALCTALSSDKLTIIECPVDASENLRFTQRLGMRALPTGVHL